MNGFVCGHRSQVMRKIIFLVLFVFLIEIFSPGIALAAEMAPQVARNAARGFVIMGEESGRMSRTLASAMTKHPSANDLLAQVLQLDGLQPSNSSGGAGTSASPRATQPMPKHPDAPKYEPIMMRGLVPTFKPSTVQQSKRDETDQTWWSAGMTVNGKRTDVEWRPGYDKPKVKVEPAGQLQGLHARGMVASLTSLPALTPSNMLMATGEVTSEYFQSPYDEFEEIQYSARSIGDGSSPMGGYAGHSGLKSSQSFTIYHPTGNIGEHLTTTARTLFRSPLPSENLSYSVFGEQVNAYAVRAFELKMTLTAKDPENHTITYHQEEVWKVFDAAHPQGDIIYTYDGTAVYPDDPPPHDDRVFYFEYGRYEWANGNWDLDTKVSDDNSRLDVVEHDLILHGWEFSNVTTNNVFFFYPDNPDPNKRQIQVNWQTSAKEPTWTMTAPRWWATVEEEALGPNGPVLKHISGTQPSGSSVNWDYSWSGTNDSGQPVTLGKEYLIENGLDGDVSPGSSTGTYHGVYDQVCFHGEPIGTELSITPNPLCFTIDEQGQLQGSAHYKLVIESMPNPPGWIIENPAWTINIKDKDLNTVRTFTGSKPGNQDPLLTIEQDWNGLDSAGKICVGEYTFHCEVSCDNFGGTIGFVSLPLTVNPPLEIRSLEVTPKRSFTDNGQTQVAVEFDLVGAPDSNPWKVKDPLYRMEIRAGGQVYRSEEPVMVPDEQYVIHVSTQMELKDDLGGDLPKGEYQVVIDANDARGSVAAPKFTSISVVTNKTIGPSGGFGFIDSVNPITGNYFTEETDLTWPTRGMAIAVGRTYNSLDAYTAPYYGWRFNFAGLEIDADQSVNVMLPDGRQDRFTRDISGNYIPARADMTDTLVKNIDNTYTLTSKHQISQIFDSGGRLDRITDQSGNTVQFDYDSEGRLTSIRDPLNHQIVVTHQVDAQGVWRIWRLTDPAGRMVEYTYNADGRLTVVRDPMGHETHYSYYEGGKGRLETVVDAGNHTVVRNTYDIRGRTDSQTNAKNVVMTFTYDDIQRVSTRTIQQKTWVVTYNLDGDILSEKDPLDNTTTYEYYSDTHRLKKATDARSNSTQLEYDAKGNITRVTDAQNHQVVITYNSTFNKPESITDPLNHVTQFTYESHGLLTQVRDALLRHTDYTYYPDGLLNTVTDNRNNTTFYYYNADGFVSEIKNALNKSSTFTWDAAGNLDTVTDALGAVTDYDYDADRRLTHVASPGNRHTYCTYDPVDNLLTVQDPLVRTTTYTYDELNRQLTVTNPQNGVITYEYDNLDNLISIRNPNNALTRYEYDDVNRLVRAFDPLNHQTQYGYDSVGNLVSRVDANGDTVTYEYDSLNRLFRINYPASNPVTFTYDPLGRRTQMVDGQGQTDYTYDPAGQLTQVARNPGKTIGYHYDGVGNVDQYFDGENIATTYAYDPLNQMTHAGRGNLQVDFQYNDVGLLTSRQMSCGKSEVFNYISGTYDLQELKWFQQGDPNPVVTFAYTYDQIGKRLSLSIITPGDTATETYQYDTLDRLTRVEYPDQVVAEYTYDPVGNRLSMSVTGQPPTTYTYNIADQLINMGPWDYVYDNVGNLTSKTDTQNNQTTSYAYDYDYHLKQVTFPDQSTAQYAYDGDGMRIRKTRGQDITNYLWAGSEFAGEYDGNGGIKAIWFLAGGPAAILDMPGTPHWYLHDGLGSVRALCLNDGWISDSYFYSEFGEQVPGPPGMPPPTTYNPLRYTGQYLDVETGNYYLRARYYDPSAGRFMTRDPIGFAGGINLYTYCGNNPVNAIDPLGLDTYLLFFDPLEKIFADAAYAKQSKLKVLHPKDDVRVAPVRSTDNINRYLQQYEDIIFMAFYVHGGQGIMFFKNSQSATSNITEFGGLYRNKYLTTSVYNLYPGNVLADAEIYIYGCYAARGGPNSLIAAFSRRFNVQVYGYATGVSYHSNKPSGDWTEGNQPIKAFSPAPRRRIPNSPTVPISPIRH